MEGGKNKTDMVDSMRLFRQMCTKIKTIMNKL